MLKFREMLRPQGHFLAAAKLLSSGEGNAETPEATNLVRPWRCFLSPFNPCAIVTFL
jgi:hypothetical protein